MKAIHKRFVEDVGWKKLIGEYGIYGLLEAYDTYRETLELCDCSSCSGDCKNQTTSRPDPEQCDHEWGTDGAHTNVFCKKCFMDKPKLVKPEPNPPSIRK